MVFYQEFLKRQIFMGNAVWCREAFYFWLHWVFVVVHRLLIVVASLVAEHGL